MDSGYAIDSFLRQVDRFSQVVFVDRDRIHRLFGEEVVETLEKLETFANRKQICNDCGGLCCRDVGCELYAPQFTTCPVHQIRPIVCRFHFCHRFDVLDKPAVIELRDIFLGCYMALDNWGHDNLRALDIPPLAGIIPEFAHLVAPWMEKVRAGQADAKTVAGRIYTEAGRILAPDASTRPATGITIAPRWEPKAGAEMG